MVAKNVELTWNNTNLYVISPNRFRENYKNMTFNLSKTQYIKGIFCHRHLWLYKNSGIKEEFTASAETIMETGTSIGELAQSLYPGGVSYR